MGIFAHPDDESFGFAGALARATMTDHPAAIVCATRGEAGEIAAGVDATPETLATIAGILERHASVQYRSMDDIRGSLGMNEGSAPLNRRVRDVAARPAFRTS